MPLLAQYDQETGAIRGLWSAGSQELLLAQIPPDAAGDGYLLVETGDPALLQERYEVRDGQVVPRSEVTLRADPPTFAADGMTECCVQVEPFVACTLHIVARGREQLVAMTREEDPLYLLVDRPMTLHIRLGVTPGYWATPLQIEAV